jgi:hypothetical protein
LFTGKQRPHSFTPTSFHAHTPILFLHLIVVLKKHPTSDDPFQAIFHYRESVKTKKTTGALPLPQDYEMSTFFDNVIDDCNFDEGVFEGDKYTWVRLSAMSPDKTASISFPINS